MKDEGYAKGSQEMIIQIKLIESMIETPLANITFDENEWLAGLDSFNIGRELLDRVMLKCFSVAALKALTQEFAEA